MSTKISDLTALGAIPAEGDLLVLVDVSDTSESADGTTKKVAVGRLISIPTSDTLTSTTPVGVASAYTSITYNFAAGGACLIDTTETWPDGAWIEYRCAGTTFGFSLAGPGSVSAPNGYAPTRGCAGRVRHLGSNVWVVEPYDSTGWPRKVEPVASSALGLAAVGNVVYASGAVTVPAQADVNWPDPCVIVLTWGAAGTLAGAGAAVVTGPKNFVAGDTCTLLRTGEDTWTVFGAAGNRLRVVELTASRNAVASDAGARLRVTAAVTYTLTSAAFAEGDWLELFADTTSAVTVATGSGVTSIDYKASRGLTLDGQFAVGRISCLSSGRFSIEGDWV